MIIMLGLLGIVGYDIVRSYKNGWAWNQQAHKVPAPEPLTSVRGQGNP